VTLIMKGIFYKEDREYPELLKQTKGAPKQLYFKDRSHSEFSSASRSIAGGSDASQKIQNAHLERRIEKKQSACSKNSDIDTSIFENCLAVVGSRRLTTYGERVMEQMVSEIAMNGITIVSGFMYGGDAAAHQAAVRAGGRTIAVMPCGIDLIHPAHQEKLYREILENKGLIISEYEGEMKPALWTYPQRNRIVAGLSKALLIIEAEEKSGCLITARCAEKFGRKIFAVPGPITGSVSRGTNILIKEGVAEMVLSAKDVLKYYRDKRKCFDYSSRFIPPKRREPYASQNNQNTNALGNKGAPRVSKKSKPLIRSGKFEKQIFELLEREAMEIDELSRGLEMPVSELSAKLSLMEIRGLIELRGNKYYVDKSLN